MPSFSTLVVLLSAAATSLGSHLARNHNELAKRMELNKRIFSPRVTWYPTNTGPDACTGKNHGDYDNIVALNMPQFGNSGNGNCGRKIKITAHGVSAIGVIQDACASCHEYGQIDLTKGLFEKFANLDKGEFTATWEFVDGDDDDNDPPPPPPPPKKTPKKTTHKVAPTTAKLVAPKPPKKTTTSKKKTSTQQSSSTKKSSSAVPSSSSTTVIPVPPTPTPPPITYPTENVGNVGADPSSSADAPNVNGGIASDNIGSNGAISLTLNSVVAGAAALLLAVQML